MAGWWLKNHLEKYEFVNGKDIPYMKWKNKGHVPNHQNGYVSEYHHFQSPKCSQQCQLGGLFHLSHHGRGLVFVKSLRTKDIERHQ
jgi:hypothetical protein